ncbi:hypothetical protein AB1Y20_013034 [Prymnesium parvum]|uniref:Uncharacterized protein n=1 Tax=Prymnesium parvum TaxID=97485 RepID=A0AB34IMD8_PRYPA
MQAWLRGDARMLAGLPANAPFFRALHAQTMAISRRGCHVAALSTALLTLSLDRVSDPTRMRLLIDGLALRAERAHTLWLLDQSYQEELRQLPGWAFSIALALRQIHSYSSAAPPIGTAAAAAAAAARGESEWEDGGTAALRRALLTFPAMLPAALQSCCGGNPAATALSARWQRVVSPLIAVAELHFGSATLQHMHALYWERVSDIWKHDALHWLQSTASSLLTELECEIGLVQTDEGSQGNGGLEPLSAVSQLKELSARARSWYPSNAPNSLHGSDFARLRAEQVVIPEEEAPPQPPPPLAVPAGEAAAAAVRDAGGGGDPADGRRGELGELAPLEEECDALAERVDEMEKMVRRGVAPQLRAVIDGRLKSLDERLTQHMCSVDAVDAGEGVRDGKRNLTRRMDELCARLADVIANFSE